MKQFNLGIISIAVLISITFTMPVLASQERVEKSMNIFSKCLDELLLETPHVYIQIDDKVRCYYLEGLGAFFINDIAMTGTSSFSIKIQDWSQWFGTKSEEADEKDDDEEYEDEEYALKKKKYKSLKQEDLERIEKMDEHIAAFKKELIATFLDFGSILKEVGSSEEVVIVFFVKDKEFKDKYNSSHLILRVRFGELKKLLDKKPADPDVQKAFTFNI